eukprot:1143410-Pyramimonas_sp.AAC.1
MGVRALANCSTFWAAQRFDHIVINNLRQASQAIGRIPARRCYWAPQRSMRDERSTWTRMRRIAEDSEGGREG